GLAAGASGVVSGASGAGAARTSHERPAPTATAVPRIRAPFVMNSRRRTYTDSGVISWLGSSGATMRIDVREFSLRQGVGRYTLRDACRPDRSWSGHGLRP